jgi:2-polyprenyl-6-methoxyphenol hydroxylase-like FAD-dependent oxidoreductase
VIHHADRAFYGQGMNSGFEDISILNEMMENMVMIGR